VLLYSGVSDRGLVSDALDAGANGFALKDAPLDDLARALDTVAAGGMYITRSSAQRSQAVPTTIASRSRSASAKSFACWPKAARMRRSVARSSCRPTRCAHMRSGRC
jgi:DNA-binding NarL/FixJ family response regulator